MKKFQPRKKPAPAKRRFTSLFLLAVLGAGFLAPFLLSPPAQSEPGPITDFRAETIASDSDLSDSEAPIPLPVELVEEQAGDEQLAVLEKTPAGNKPDGFTLDVPEGQGNEFARGLTADELAASTTELNLSDVDIAVLIKTFSKLTRRNYIVDSGVKGKVTIHQETPVTLAEALRIFDTVLLLKGYTTVPVEENVWKVVQVKNALQSTIPLVRVPNEITSDVLVTQLIRLKHTSADDMRQLLSQFISTGGLIQAVGGSNSLIVIDSESNIQRLRELIDEVDVPALNQEITIIPVVHAEIDDIAEKIKEILGEEEEQQNQARTTLTSRIPRATNIRRNTSARVPSSSASTGIPARQLPLKVIPDERTNSLIVVADPEMTLKVQALVEQLDSELDRAGGRFWVHRLENADAEELAEILNNLISGATEGDSTSASTTRGSSLTRAQSSSRSSSASSRASRERLSAAYARSSQLLRQAASARSGGSSGGRVSLEGEVSIAPDPATNSLIINASRSDYMRLREVIQALDTKRRQVLVEATILEVMLTEDMGMGVELQGTAGFDDKGGLIGQTNFGGISNLLTNPTALTDLTIAAASTGTLTLPGGVTIPSQAILIQAVSRHQNVNVLSSPTILSTDNEEAEIIVGENVPFVSSTSTDTSNINNTFNSIERQDVGITLRFTPQIGAGESITLKIFIEISNVVAGTRNDPNGPTTTIRTTDTSVVVRNQQMIVTGGLIQDSHSDSQRGVPFWEDIPVLGQLFQRQDSNTRRTNLLVFITPRIIADQFEAREETKELAGRLQYELDLSDTGPDRTGVLRNEDMDNVVQQYEPPAGAEIAPTTIYPPLESLGEVDDARAKAARRRTFDRLEKLSAEQSPSTGKIRDQSVPNSEVPYSESLRGDEPAPETDQEIDITVAPALPSASRSGNRQPEARAASASRGDAPREQHSMRRATIKPRAGKPSAGTAKTFVVLRALSATAGEQLPFSFADSDGTFGLVLPGAPGSASTSQFRAGQRYSYNREGKSGDVVCLGIYATPDEAGIVHPGMAATESWHRISPGEALALDKAGWSASRAAGGPG